MRLLSQLEMLIGGLVFGASTAFLIGDTPGPARFANPVFWLVVGATFMISGRIRRGELRLRTLEQQLGLHPAPTGAPVAPPAV